jgi:hypothetical protein
LNPAEKSVGLTKSADSVGVNNQISPSRVLNSGHVGASLLDSISSQSKQSPQIMAFIQSLGLPQDALSSSLLSFFKFFALPLDAQSLKQIRREVLESKPLKDSIALAASAAFDKGVALNEDALKEYAAAIDPADHRREQGSYEQSGNRSGAETGFEQSNQNNQQEKHAEEKNIHLSDDIHHLIDEIDANGSVLRYLNKIPGKNGQKWIVLPFNFTSENVEFSVSLRILLNESDNLHHSVERLAIDVQTNDRRWFFLMLKEENDSYSGKIALHPNISTREQSILLKELEEILENFVSDICFIDENDILSFVDSRNDSIISVDEEV